MVDLAQTDMHLKSNLPIAMSGPNSPTKTNRFNDNMALIKYGGCAKQNCNLPAYGKCGWRNPCAIPSRYGGCGEFYCELHASTFTTFRRFQVCSTCQESFRTMSRVR